MKKALDGWCIIDSMLESNTKLDESSFKYLVMTEFMIIGKYTPPLSRPTDEEDDFEVVESGDET